MLTHHQHVLILYSPTNEDVVTTSALPASWTAVLRELGFDLDTVAAPSGEEDEWNRLLATFERRGFFMLWAKEYADTVRFRLELALPPEASSTSLHTALDARLSELHATQTNVSAQGPPQLTYTTFASDLAAQDVRAVGMMLLKLSDYVRAVEEAPDAPLPFAASEQPPNQAVFETIGEGSKEQDASSEPVDETPEAEEKPKKSWSNVFETIGDGKPTVHNEAVHLKAYTVSAPSPEINVELTLDTHPDPSLRHVLTRGLKQALEVRFDVRVEETPRQDDTITFHVQSASASYPLSRRDREDMESFFNRLVKFGALGMDLFGALNLNTQGDQSPSTRARREHETLTALPKLNIDDARASHDARTTRAASEKHSPQEASGVVLSFGETEDSGGSSSSEQLEPQRYDDERLNRHDATTPLVDIILRHPGFSDRRIGQVLSILLSIDTLQAKNLIAQAPCAISWGVSRERALTFKSAIEGAGAKALLVEPGTFTTR